MGAHTRRSQISLEQQLDMLPQLQEPILLATSVMSRNFVRDTENMTKSATAFDPALIDSECVFKPTINKKSAQMAAQGRETQQKKFSRFLK